MAYSWLTFAQAKTALANRLSDPSKVFWIDDELGRILKESLRTWNSIAQFYRDRTTFNSKANLAVYDLTLPTDPNAFTGGTGNLASNPPAFLGYTIKDRDLILDIEYHLMEPITTVWSPLSPALTEQFTMSDITRAIERRRNQFLLDTGLNLAHSQVAYSGTDGRVALSQLTQMVRRASFKPTSTGIFNPLWREDEESANFLSIGWSTNPGLPEAYSMFLPPPITIQLIPPSSGAGAIDLITVDNPADLDETTGVFLNIPDDWAWVVKWGALADLLARDGQAYDPARSQYCDSRYKEGIRFILLGATITNTTINNKPVRPSDLTDFDSMVPGWQNISGTPTDLAIAGRNLVALYPVPTSTSHTVQLDVLRNMPIPTIDADFIQVGKEHFDAILDYCFHLAYFKVSSKEFEATMEFANRFMRLAMLNNRYLMAEAKDYDIVQSYSKKEDVDRIRMTAEQEQQNAA